ncbi:MAG TPA: ribosome biogenesis GTP-binding protein YihA/YsxC [Bryobacteraceae bacterium]|nr:ribosome biogenesis GTP-binding protein YihA/YsxC [Bryobacteraceae bacterium]
MATPHADARFILSATSPAQFPNLRLPEFAFLGRSNVGKSSLLNVLAGVKKLAKVSQQPGRTQAVNFFTIGEAITFADLPGYGFAKVPIHVQQSWKSLIEAYLSHREQLALCFILLDARRGWMEKDLELRDWLIHQGRPFLVIATKIDKLKQSELHRGLAAIRRECEGSEPVPFSAISGQGAREIWQAIKTSKTR